MITSEQQRSSTCVTNVTKHEYYHFKSENQMQLHSNDCALCSHLEIENKNKSKKNRENQVTGPKNGNYLIGFVSI